MLNVIIYLLKDQRTLCFSFARRRADVCPGDEVRCSRFPGKPFNDQELLELVQKAVGRSVWSIRHLELRQDIQQRYDSLSQRERQVLDGLITGNPTKVIAWDLGLSPKTVEIHRGNISKKMKAKFLVEIAIIVTKFGLIKENSLLE